jgi:hypothetical protein
MHAFDRRVPSMVSKRGMSVQVRHESLLGKYQMIYLLVQKAYDCEDYDRNVFASSNKEMVEQVRHRLMERNKFMQVIAKRYQADIEKIGQLKSRAPSPLERHKEVLLAIEELAQQYSKEYYMPVDEIKGIFAYVDDTTYSIEEIQDDPNVDVSKL